MALTDYSIDTSGSPQDVQRKQALADALMKQGMDSSAAAGGKGGGWVTALNRGLAGALGGYQRGAAANEEQQGRAGYNQQLAAALGGGDGKVTPQAMIGLAGNPWANPAQTQAISHVSDMQAQQARQGVEDQHWKADYGLRAEANRRAGEEKPVIKEMTNPDGTTGFVRISPSGPQGPITGLTPTAATPAAPMASGPEYLSSIKAADPGRAATIEAMIEGRIPPPSGAALRNPLTLKLVEDASRIDPQFDANAWKTRSKFATEFGSTSPSSVGGQKVLMQTSLGHLGEVAGSAADMNNSNGMGLADIGHAYNYVGNRTTENAAKANALSDKVAKFSGEVGKLYSGSQGGGVHEREDTRNRLGANMTPAELASGLEAARDLIKSKQKALEDQAASIYGPERAAKFDFVGPDGRAALDKVEKAIAKLKGGSAAPVTEPKAASSQGNGADAMLSHARDALAQGAPRQAVLDRLKQAGIDASGL